MSIPKAYPDPALIRERDRLCGPALEMYERGEIEDGETISAVAVANNGRPVAVIVLTGRDADAWMARHIADARRRTSRN